MLDGRGPADLQALVVRLATRMVVLGGRAATDEDAEQLVQQALASGAALEKFAALVARQGGDARIANDPTRLPQAAQRIAIETSARGVVISVDAEMIGRAAMLLGAGRDRADATIDHAAGIILHRKPGETVSPGDTLMELHVNDARRLDDARRLAHEAVTIGDTAEPPGPLVLDWIHAEHR
jgi:thymidine phosphorylase